MMKQFQFRTILPRKGEVAGACQTEGGGQATPVIAASPSDAFGATSPWRGRTGGLATVRRLEEPTFISACVC